MRFFKHALAILLLVSGIREALFCQSPSGDKIFLHIAKDQLNCMYGLKDDKGNWVVPASYTYMYESNDGSGDFLVVLNEKKGVVNSEGLLVVEPKFSDISSFNTYNTAFYRFRNQPDGPYGLLDRRTGKISLAAEYDWISVAYDKTELFFIRKDKLYGLANSNKELITPRYTFLEHLYAGKYFVFSQSLIKSHDGRDSIFDKGIINLEGDIIVPTVYHEFAMVNDKFWGIRNDKDGRMYGLLDLSGKVLLEPLYRYEHKFNVPDFTAHGTDVLIRNSLYELVDSNGHILTKSPYVYMKSLKADKQMEGKAVAIYRKKDRYGLLGLSGKVLLKAQYASLQSFVRVTYENGKLYNTYCFIAVKQGLYGIVDEKGDILFPFECEFIYHRGEDVFMIRQGIHYALNEEFKPEINHPRGIPRNSIFCTGSDSYYCFCCGILNDSGRVLLDPAYRVSSESAGKMQFENIDGVRGYVTNEGRITYAKDSRYKRVGQFENGYAWAVTHRGKMGIVNEDEELVIDTAWDVISVYDASKGICWVKPTLKIDAEEDYDEEWVTDRGWGLVDQTGKLLLDTVYFRPQFFKDAYVILKNDELKSGLVRSDGSIVFPFEYHDIRPQDDGLLLVNKNGLWGLADTSGRLIIQPVWEEASDFLGDYMLFRQGTAIRMMHRSGKIIQNPEQFYNATGKYLADSLVFRDMNWNGRRMELSSLIANYERLDSFPEGRCKVMLSNRAMIKACENYFIGGNLMATAMEGEEPAVFYDEDKFSEEYDDHFIVSEGVDYSVSLQSANRRSFSLDITAEQYYIPSRGPGNSRFSHEYLNYGFAKDSLYLLGLDDLFRKGYERPLNLAIINCMKDIDDPGLDCSNPEQYLENLENSFTIGVEGLTFYLPLQDDYNDDEIVELLVPYTAIRGLINQNGVLGEFVK